jgi:hypothetical protein
MRPLNKVAPRVPSEVDAVDAAYPGYAPADHDDKSLPPPWDKAAYSNVALATFCALSLEM